MAVTVATLRETAANERRVALTPEVAKKLKALGADVRIETGAGLDAAMPDDLYKDAQAVASANDLLAKADVVLAVQPPETTASRRCAKAPC